MKNKKFIVKVDDNFHFMDESERYIHGEYDTLEEAVAVCQGIVEESLDNLISQSDHSLTNKELIDRYHMFGEDPWISGEPEGVHFSAWDYATERAKVLTSKKKEYN